jgi:hypothetical protein
MLAQDTDGSTQTALRQTFRSRCVGNDETKIVFESMSIPGQYLITDENGLLVLGDSDEAAASPYTVEQHQAR